MTRNDKSQLTPQQEELIRLCRKPDPDGQDALMLRLWFSEWLRERQQNPTNVLDDSG